MKSKHYKTNFEEAFKEAFRQTNKQMHKQKKRMGKKKFDDSMSGTTGIVCAFEGKEIIIGNVGDSRAVVAQEKDGKLFAHALSIDQTPYRKDERERCKAQGAAIMTMDQLDGLKDPNDDNYGNEDDDDGDPPRLWYPGQGYP